MAKSFLKQIASCLLSLLVLGLAPRAWADDVRIVPLATRDIVFEPHSNLLFASVGNSIQAIDPETGAVAFSITVGEEPNRLAVSDDGRYLYVGSDGAGVLQRVDLSQRRVDQEIELRSLEFGNDVIVADVAVQPGNSKVIAVSLRHRIPEAQGRLGGSVRVTSSIPIFALQLFGSSDSLRFLANVPVQ